MTEEQYKKLRAKYALSFITMLGGYTLLWVTTGFLPMVSIFLIHMGINFERNADTIKLLLKVD